MSGGYTIALLPGDGIGAEILDGPVAFLRRLERTGAPVRITGPWPYGTTGWAQTGSSLPTVLDHAAPTYDLAPPGSQTIGLDEFNARVLDALPLEAHR